MNISSEYYPQKLRKHFGPLRLESKVIKTRYAHNTYTTLCTDEDYLKTQGSLVQGKDFVSNKKRSVSLRGFQGIGAPEAYVGIFHEKVSIFGVIF